MGFEESSGSYKNRWSFSDGELCTLCVVLEPYQGFNVAVHKTDLGGHDAEEEVGYRCDYIGDFVRGYVIQHPYSVHLPVIVFADVLRDNIC